MPILTVRLTDSEQRTLSRRAKQAGKKKSSFVRDLIREDPFVSGKDILDGITERMGDTRLKITARQ